MKTKLLINYRKEVAVTDQIFALWLMDLGLKADFSAYKSPATARAFV